MPLTGGARLGRYEILAPLGAGGMGEVYRARDPRLRREVALKILPTDLALDPDRLRRFEQEARAASALSHPNILSVFDVGEDGGLHFLVTELLEGKSLRERLAGRALPTQRALDYASQVARGLAAAHDRGIVHRDIKPENLFVTQDGNVKILDFGLAKLAGELGASHVGAAPTAVASATGSGVVVGTVGYMSPEQVRAQGTDFRSDQFSLGCVLYEMLAGEAPFHRESGVQTMAAILEDEPAPLAQASPRTPAPVAWVIERCLAKDPTERFASTRDLAHDLQRLHIHLSELSGLTASTAAASGSKARAKRTAWLVAVAALALVASVVLFLLSRRPHQPPVYHRLTFRRGNVALARFAPDQKTILYSARWGVEPYVEPTLGTYTTRSDSPGEAAELPVRGFFVLAVSPTGQVALLRGPGRPSSLAEMAMNGSAARDLAENVVDADYSPEGRLAVIREVGERSRLEYPIGKVLYESPPHVWIDALRVSPRGDRIAFLEPAATKKFEEDAIRVVDLSGKVTTLVKGWADALSLAWDPATEEVWFTARPAGSAREDQALRAVDLAGKVRVVAYLPDVPKVQDIARDGRALLVVFDHDMVRLRCLPPGGSAEVDLSWGASHPADISADGETLLIFENSVLGGAAGALFLRRLDGTAPVRLGTGTATALSPDGHWALALRPELPHAVALVPTGAGEERILGSDDLDYQDAAWLPDGTGILVEASRGRGARRVYVQGLDGSRPRPVTPEGVGLGPVSPDGIRMVSRDANGTPALFALAGGHAQPLPTLTADDQILRWDTSGGALFVVPGEDAVSLARPGGITHVQRVDVASGRRQPWKEIPAGARGPMSLKLSSDGRTYCYDSWQPRSTLYVVEGLR